MCICVRARRGQRREARTKTSTARARRLRFPPLRARVYTSLPRLPNASFSFFCSSSFLLARRPRRLLHLPPPLSLSRGTSRALLRARRARGAYVVVVVVTAVYMHAPAPLYSTPGVPSPLLLPFPLLPPGRPRTERRSDDGRAKASRHPEESVVAASRSRARGERGGGGRNEIETKREGEGGRA